MAERFIRLPEYAISPSISPLSPEDLVTFFIRKYNDVFLQTIKRVKRSFLIMIENPFITYGYESAAYFCDRKAETRELVTLLTNGNHAALISPRRMGKTGLIQRIFKIWFIVSDRVL